MSVNFVSVYSRGAAIIRTQVGQNNKIDSTHETVAASFTSYTGWTERSLSTGPCLFVGYRVFGHRLKDWRKEIDPDVWLDAQKVFKKFFHYPQHIQREHLELLLRPCPWPLNK